MDELKTLAPADLMALLKVDRALRKQRLRRTIGVILFCYLILMPLFAYFINHNVTLIFFWMGVPAGIGMLSVSKARQAAVSILSQFDRLDTLPELIDALEIPSLDVQNSIRPALIRLLPQLKASDSALIGLGQGKVLRRFLSGHHARSQDQTFARILQPELMVAILNALQQVGDKAYYKTVFDVQVDPHWQAYPEVVAAAKACMPYLSMNIANQKLSAQLVRAADPNTMDGKETLLRATGTVHEEASEALLRPVNGSDVPEGAIGAYLKPVAASLEEEKVQMVLQDRGKGE